MQSAISIVNVESNKFANLTFAITKMFENITSNSVETLDVITADASMKARDFKEELFTAALESCKDVIRHESASMLTLSPVFKRQNVILLIENFEDFSKFHQNMRPKLFKFNGFYLIVLVNGKINEIEKMFQLLWKLQVFRVFVVFEAIDGSVLVQSFMPFKSENCNDTTPILVDIFKDGKFDKDKRNLFADKTRNLNNCSVRVSVGNNTEPFVISRLLTNGTYDLKGSDIKIINALSENLNFKIEYVYIGHEGYFLENGKSEGPLRHLLDSKADLSITNWWLKTSRLKFLDATSPYLSDQIIFVVPPGRELTAFEKLIFPFTLLLWLFIVWCFLIGFLVIFIIKRRSKATRNFVFGKGVINPFLNMFTGFIGGSQKVLPKRNFGRFLLMTFLLYSLVIRTLYQGSFYILMRSHKGIKEVQSIDEMIEKDFVYIVYKGNSDILEGSETLASR